jgi:soluble lytic murein transglycosylase
MPNRTASSAIVIALCLCLAAPAAASRRDGARVLERDPNAGGPAGIALETLGPLFDDAEINRALGSLDEGRPDMAIALLGEWVTQNRESPLRDEALLALGYGLYTASRWEDALLVLPQCAAESPLFADYCMFWAADAALRLEDAERAEAMAAVVTPDSVFGPRAWYLKGRALLAMGRVEDAVRELEGFLAAYPGAWYRNDVEFTLAEAYEAAGEVDEAAQVYHRVAVVNPGSGAESRAQEAIARLSDALSRDVRQRVRDRTQAETLARARVLFDRHRSEQVISLLEPVVAATEPGSTIFCEASYLVGKSYSKLRQHSASLGPYANVIDHCDDEDLVVKALYNAGRGAWNVDADDAATAHFEQLWSGFPHNSYADDAVLLAARVHRSNDNEAQYVSLLQQQIRDFPTGDMLGDAVWLLAGRLYTAGQHRELISFVDELGSRTGEADIYSRGRLAYFRARSLEALSRTGEARAAYAQVARDNPMAYYSLLALNRLRDLAPEQAMALVTELAAGDAETEGTIRISPPEAALDPHFQRGRTLLRLGLYTLAQGEFDKLQASYANEDEIGWVVSLLYHHAGAYDRSHHVPGDREDLKLSWPAPANMERWTVAYPTPFSELVFPAAEERTLDAFWVYAIMREESGFRPRIESWANARGLLQLMEGTANDMARLTGRGSVRTSDLFDPAINVELGTQYMRVLADLYDAHPALIFAGYNGGQGNVNRWLRERGDLPLDLWVEEIPYDQTRNYVKRVTMTWWVYHWMDGNLLPPIPWRVRGG